MKINPQDAEMRDKIVRLLKCEETSDPIPPYSCLPPSSSEWREIKADRILTLINSEYGTVECGECRPFLYHPQIGGERGRKWNSRDGVVFCASCNKGWRELVVRVECIYCAGVNFGAVADPDACPYCEDRKEIAIPYPIDFNEHPELVGKSFTVEMKE